MVECELNLSKALMRFNPRHVLVGESDSYDSLLEAQEIHPHFCSWIVPKSSKQGDTVLILIGKEFVGEAVIRADAKPSSVLGEYVSTLGAIRLWEPGIGVENIQRQLPEWKFLTYTRSYASVPDEYKERLRGAINRELEREVELEAEESALETFTAKRKNPQEVISIPAGNSIRITEDNGVHACPDEYPWSSYQEADYMAFRHPGGAMKRLYKLEWKGILPRLSADLALVPEEHRDRVQRYIERRESEWHFTGRSFQFYVLSMDDSIELTHAPRLVKNIQGHCYFRLTDLLSGEKVVTVASKSLGAPPPPKSVPLKQLIEKLEKSQEQAQGAESFGEDEAFDVDDFDPETLTEAREYQARQIVARRGQVRFRQRLLQAYGEQCAFTDYFGKEALEAAHIIPFSGADSDHVGNGLLLRADIHTLFDQGLLAVDTLLPDEPRLILAPTLLASSYKLLQGRKVRLPQNEKLRPSVKALEWHRKQTGL